ncbi:MAG: glycosyltransferase [Vicinamibacteria bacterium]|nr:glycosyltransferase [Vicinamibacteria bacterium]
MVSPELFDLKSPARRRVALLVCRLYAVLPCVITPLVTGFLCAIENGVFAAAGLVIVSSALMAVRFPDFREKSGAMALNALFYFTLIALPPLVLPFAGPAGFLAGAIFGSVLSLAVIGWIPRVPRVGSMLQPELFPDVLTGLILSLLFYIPVFLLKRPRLAPLEPAPPFDVAVILCAYQEEATIDESLASIRVAVDCLRGSPLVKRVRVILVDSSPVEATRRRVASQVDRVIDGDSGKLSARHQAMRLENADIFVAADADRRYDPEWLVTLLAPFADPRVVATMGETRNAGAGMSASALCRATLKLPYNGGNSAFFRSAYFAAPFATTIDQGRHKELWVEEEFLFGLTLQAQGRIAHVMECRSYELRPYPLFAQLSRHLFGVRLRTF